MADMDRTRRALLGGASAGAAVCLGAAQAHPPATSVRFEDTTHRISKRRGGETIELYVYRKRAVGPGAIGPRPNLFLVHGSSNSAKPSFDLQYKGGAYSSMLAFAKAGFDVWTMDHENYGRSARTNGNSDIASGAEDLKAAADFIAKETGTAQINFFGHSSGALRATLFASKYPDQAGRLALAAYTYTGDGSATLADRAKQVEFYRNNNRRPRDRETIRSMFTRDYPGTTDAEIPDVYAEQELVFGDTVPTGTYLDMVTKLPIVQPAQVHSPVLMIRGEFDGIATDRDLLEFYLGLPNGDKQYIVIPGSAHTLTTNKNRALVEHAVTAFMTMPRAVPIGREMD